MREERRRLSAVGDGLLLACVRLYLFNKRTIPYKINARLVSRMVSNEKLIEIAARLGITCEPEEKLSDAFEVGVAEYYFKHGFRDTKFWLWTIYDEHFDLAGEVRRILEPTPTDKVEKQIRGALKSLSSNGAGLDVQKAAQVIVRVLKEAGSI